MSIGFGNSGVVGGGGSFSGGTVPDDTTFEGDVVIEGTLDVTGVATFTTTVTGSGEIYAGAAFDIGFTGRGKLKSSADGIIELLNAAEDGFTRLNFGGATSSFPALSRTTTSIRVVLGNGTTGGQFIAASGTAAAPSLCVNGTTPGVCGLYDAGSDVIAISTFGVGRGMWDQASGSARYVVTQPTAIAWATGALTANVAADTRFIRVAAAILGVEGATAGTAGGFQPARSANGAYIRTVTDSENLTLETGGTTSDTAGNLLHANSEILWVLFRVTTTITTAASWDAGDATTGNRFVDGSTSLTAGNTVYGTRHRDPSTATTAATGPIQTAAAAVRITTNANPGAGAIRITVCQNEFVAPTS